MPTDDGIFGFTPFAEVSRRARTCWLPGRLHGQPSVAENEPPACVDARTPQLPASPTTRPKPPREPGGGRNRAHPDA
eukprot:353445-Chlamydomonas_euryale.AAC.29